MIGKSVYPHMLCVVFLVTIAVVSANVIKHHDEVYTPSQRSHILSYGIRKPGDYLAVKRHVRREPVADQMVSALQYLNVSTYETITSFTTYDIVSTDGEEAMPQLFSGGPGTNDVTLSYSSRWGKGINYIIEIYAIGKAQISN